MNTQGYTLLEVSLFLAISAGLTVVAFVGLGPRLRNVRFTAAVRSLESSLSRQLVEAQAGGSTRSNGSKCELDLGSGNPVLSDLSGTPTGSSQDCVINGQLAVLGSKSVTYYSIISLRRSCDPAPAKLDEVIGCNRPTIQSEPSRSPQPSEVEYANGLTGSNVDASRAFTTSQDFAFGYLQDPNSSSRYNFIFTNASGIGSANALSITVAGGNTWQDDQPHAFCGALGTRRVKLIFKTNQALPVAEFNPAGGC